MVGEAVEEFPVGILRVLMNAPWRANGLRRRILAPRHFPVPADDMAIPLILIARDGDAFVVKAGEENRHSSRP